MIPIIILVALCLLAIPTLAVTTYTSTETFESQTTGTGAPSASWYTFTKHWVNKTCNVSASSKLQGTKEFNVTDWNGTSSYFQFAVANKNYSEISFWFLMPSGYGTNNTKLIVSYLNATGSTSTYYTIYVLTTDKSHVNVTMGSYVLLSNNTKYKFTMTFNWTTNKQHLVITNATGVTKKDFGWTTLSVSAGLLSAIKIGGFTESKMMGYFDNFEFKYLYSVYYSMDSTTSNLLLTVLPLLIAVLILLFIVGLAFTMGLTKESLITIMIVTIFGIIIIQIILGL